MIIELMLICALTNIAPYYDCDEHWIIEIHDEVNLGDGIICPLAERNWLTVGCQTVKWDYVVLKIGTYKGLDEYGMTVLEHEIKHGKCMCDWHGAK